ncbi:unnamed protein product [Urochloa humidicola]
MGLSGRPRVRVALSLPSSASIPLSLLAGGPLSPAFMSSRASARRGTSSIRAGGRLFRPVLPPPAGSWADSGTSSPSPPSSARAGRGAEDLGVMDGLMRREQMGRDFFTGAHHARAHGEARARAGEGTERWR